MPKSWNLSGQRLVQMIQRDSQPGFWKPPLQLGENQRMDKNQRDERRRQEDIALTRGLIWVGAAIVLELLLLLINKYYVNIYSTQESIDTAYAVLNGMKVVRIAALAGGLLCCVWVWLNLKKHKPMALPAAALAACAALCFTTHFAISFSGSGVRMLFLLVPAWAALALAYYLYQREFFFSAFFSSMGVIALWLIRHHGSHAKTMYLFLVLMVLVLAAGWVLLSRVRKNGGTVTIAGRSVNVLSKDANYKVMAITAAVNVAAVVLGLVLGGTVSYYLMYVLVAWLFALLVYFTVKMM